MTRGKADYDTDDVDLEDNAVNDDIGEEYQIKFETCLQTSS